MLVFPRVFWYTKEDFGITVSILLAKSSKFHSNSAKFCKIRENSYFMRKSKTVISVKNSEFF